ncbi:vesicle coat component [Lithohypha guttulata]|uniref:Protein transport protein sec16 n=1 Tax=Lithohypha guttulata TaxID=1690604 RepID=A0AAN7Y4Q1_9EURO|nr:vesicle coat component [Lithohypha guttulata]
MDFSNLSRDDQDETMTTTKESHWQPALRPNDDEMEQSDVSWSVQQQQIEGPTQRPSLQLSMSHFSFSHQDDDEEEVGEQSGPARLDPSWGIKRTDSAHLLDNVRRSPSFPPPEPDLNQVERLVPVQTSSHALSDDRIGTEEEPEPLSNAAEVEYVPEVEGIEDPEKSRYDEGVPLISSEPHPRNQPESVSQEDDYFTQLEQKPDETDLRPSLERKETEDVLDSLGASNTTPDSPPLPAIPESDQELPPTSKEIDLAAAFGDGLEGEEDLAAAFAQTAEPEQDPWKAAMDDGDNFLVDDADDLLSDSEDEQQPQPSQQLQVARGQQARTSAVSHSNPYAPHQPSTAELTQFDSTTQNIGLQRPMQSPMNAFQAQQRPSNINNRAASYVDQAKGGYKSPYDLPMDLAPKKRVQTQRVASSTNAVPPPPRSSSINTDKQLQSPFSPHPPSYNTLATSSPLSPPTTNLAAGPVQAVPPAAKRQASGFFEELPIAPKSRPPQPAPRIPVSQPQSSLPSLPPYQNTGFAANPVQQQQPPQQAVDPYAQFQLQRPENLDPYANVPIPPTQSSLGPTPPAVASRYSPAPPAAVNGIKASPSPRYSPAPPAQAAGPRYSPAPPVQANRYVSQPLPGASFPHLPRTSSPLAQHRRSIDDTANRAPPRPLPPHHAASFSAAAATSMSPPRGMDPAKQEIVPPRRPQTQSPSRQMTRPGIPSRIVPPPNRPTSALGQLSPTRSQPLQSILSPPRQSQLRPVEQLDYIRPADETVNDPLERWKGAPIFTFGFGGTIITSFPKRTPRYNAAATRPQIKATAGEVNIKKLNSVLNPSENSTEFPGPLKGKTKKKDILTWLSSSIKRLEADVMSHPSKRLEEKVLLWKTIRVLVEQDGNLDTPQAVQNVSALLLPGVYGADDLNRSENNVQDLSSGIYRPASFTAKTETVDPLAVEGLRKTLLKGKREDAVWQAVDSRLWSHALLLASTLDRSVWKQVVAEFVRQEVRTIGANSDSLCAFYEILGGNLEESIDQLVPPSARAGLQMVSKIESAGPTRNALDGLDRWKETLCLVLNNRSHEDQRALLTLARLLSDYGRIEAAHMCYLFARSPALPHMFGGADDQNTMIVLLGTDHQRQQSTFHNDTDAILLTEVYEFVTSSLTAGSTGAPMPHLAAFKLRRANELADIGMKAEAQAYCDAIAAGLKSNTKHSPYYNPLLLGEVEDLSNRLKQVPVQSASWIAKPSVERVTGSLLSKFSSFVIGEDSDAESKGSAREAAEAQPFANISGSPSLSRNASQTDLYGSYPTPIQMTPVVAATAAGSRYAPNVQPAFGGYTPLEPPFEPQQQAIDENEYVPEQAQTGFEPPSADTGYGYQPPDDAGYVPYEPEPESEDEKSKPKKSFVDDDEDFARVANNVPAPQQHDGAAEQARKKANDAAADAAFRAAAEEDAKRAKEQAAQKKGSGSWLGSFFGGAKKPESLDAGSSNKGGDAKVHRVHLGESKMKLYYDKDKKKWINPDNPEASEKKAAPPPPRSNTSSVPPPMGGPPRSVSTPFSLPAGGLSRSGTPVSVAVDTGSEGGDSRPGTGHGQPAGFAATLPPGTQQSLGIGGTSSSPTPSSGPAPPGSGPPTRPPSALSNASGLDDLLGGPPGAGNRRVSGRAAKGKKGRYVDVMAQ